MYRVNHPDSDMQGVIYIILVSFHLLLCGNVIYFTLSTNFQPQEIMHRVDRGPWAPQCRDSFIQHLNRYKVYSIYITLLLVYMVGTVKYIIPQASPWSEFIDATRQNCITCRCAESAAVQVRHTWASHFRKSKFSGILGTDCPFGIWRTSISMEEILSNRGHLWIGNTGGDRRHQTPAANTAARGWWHK